VGKKTFAALAPPDEAMNCDEGQNGHWMVNLVTHGNFTALRCCGP
jgi:hypothetical protein